MDRLYINFTRLTQRTIPVPQFSQLAGLHLLQTQRGVLRFVGGAYQLINLQMQNIVVAVLGVLNEEHHQERNDRGRRVDDELPGVVVVEIWPCSRPGDDQEDRCQKGLRATRPVGKCLAKACKSHLETSE